MGHIGESQHQLIEPMLTTAAPRPPQGEGWAFEVKWDGVRAISYLSSGSATALSRNNKDLSRSFPEIDALARMIGDRAVVLDGELVAIGGDGRPSFGLLQQRLGVGDPSEVTKRARRVPAVYIAFDLLRLDGRSLLDLSFDDRRAQLCELAGTGADAKWGTTARIADSYRDVNGDDVLSAARDGGLEGIVAKMRRSPYRPGRRTGEWVKVKLHRSQEAVIGGWTIGQGARAGGLGALLLGVPGAGGLTYIGRVGTGFSEVARRELMEKLRPLASAASPFSAGLTSAEMAGVHFARPVLVGEVQYGNWTPDGRLRHPTWRGLRPDKAPEDVGYES